MTNFDLEDYLIVIITIIVFIALIVLVLFVIREATATCIEYEDLCYHEVCSKGCIDKPTECSAPDVAGHKDFCTKYKYWGNK